MVKLPALAKAYGMQDAGAFWYDMGCNEGYLHAHVTKKRRGL
jgi:hypothetical protein